MIHSLASVVYGETLSDRAANIIEYEVHKDASWNPFAGVWSQRNEG